MLWNILGAMHSVEFSTPWVEFESCWDRLKLGAEADLYAQNLG
jgi:hypothetical protein